MTNQQEAINSHLQAEKAILTTAKPVDKIDAYDLKYYKTLLEAATTARKELDELQNQIKDTENKAIYTNGALSSFSEYIQSKYNISKDHSVDSETGEISFSVS